MRFERENLLRLLAEGDPAFMLEAVVGSRYNFCEAGKIDALTVPLSVAVHAGLVIMSSVTITLYVPGASPVAVCVVWANESSHK